jgi:long-chain fatty acid transport protein
MRLANVTLGIVLAALFASALVVSSAGEAGAQPVDPFGLGSRGTALAGAVTADVADASANYYNPAGIVRDGKLRLMLGYLYATPDLHVNGRDSSPDDISGVVFGLLVPGEIGGVKFGFGLGGHIPDGRVSRSRSLPRRQPRWELYDNRPHRTYLAASVAVAPVPWLRVGGGIGFQALSANNLFISGDLGLLGAERSTDLVQRVSFELQTIRFPQAGIQVDPTDWLSIGATYRGAYKLSADLIGEVRASLLAPGLDPFAGYVFLETASVNCYVPHQISLGTTLRPLDGLSVRAELTWLNWSAYESPVGLSDVTLTIAVPENLADLIRVPSSITPGRPIPSGFQDRFVPRLAVEYTHKLATDVSLAGRLGYLYENSPAPEQTGFTNLIDTDRHALSAGVGIRLATFRPLLDGWLDLDLSFQWSILADREHQKISPVDPVGDFVAGGNIYTGGASLEVGFN